MLEETIVANLVLNEGFSRAVFPYIKDEYFEDADNRLIFKLFKHHMNKYKELPSKEALRIMVDAVPNLPDDRYKNIIERIESLEIDPDTSKEWLVDETEKFCQERDLFNSIRKAILIIQGEDKEHDKGEIPTMLADSLGVCFDSNLGHDYFDDAEARYEFYHREEEKYPLDIEMFNKITGGGFRKKSLIVFMAETGGGKTILKCHMAANQLMYGKNVLYVTMEMAEERIAERIDANLLGVTIGSLNCMERDVMLKKIERIRARTPGKLKIKEYPTGSVSVAHIRHLLNEMRTKEKFVPDVIFLDYLNIMASARMSGGNNNSYSIVKSIAEEVRGLAMEFNIPIISSTQFNRSGYGNSDVDMTAVSESMGLTFTVDALFAIISTEELAAMNQVMIKQLKNRWGDINYYRRFVIGMDKSRMRLFDVDDTAQENLANPEESMKPLTEKSKSNKAGLFNVGEIT